MLTKMAWRLQNEPETDWERVIKGKYFQDTNLLDKTKGGCGQAYYKAKTSFKNKGPRVGNGESI